MNQWQDAEQFADRALDMYERGRWAEAEVELRKALQIDPDTGEVKSPWDRLGEMLPFLETIANGMKQLISQVGVGVQDHARVSRQNNSSDYIV